MILEQDVEVANVVVVFCRGYCPLGPLTCVGVVTGVVTNCKHRLFSTLSTLFAVAHGKLLVLFLRPFLDPVEL